MRKLGIIGGLTWVATRTYYERINKLVQKTKAPPASAPLLIDSLDYAAIYAAKADENWPAIGEMLSESARRLAAGGAEGILIAANTFHKVYDTVAAATTLPVLHIADTVADAMQAAKCESAALLGTRHVMTETFYRKRLVARGIELLPPVAHEVEMIDGIIYKELVLGRVTRDAERALKTIITHKEREGADAIVLACAELEMVVDINANVLPVFDSTEIHCKAAAQWILSQETADRV